jgi:molybdopterin converting factor small subunit
MASIKIPTPLRAYTGNQAEVTASGGTIAEVLEDLLAQYPDLRTHLFQDGKLRSFVNVFLGEEDIRFLSGVETTVAPDAKIRIIPTIAGGRA